jgi:hypothetical protein
MNTFRWLVRFVPMVVLGALGCGLLGSSVATVVVLGNPQYADDFATSGKFSLNILPVSLDSTVIQLSDPSSVQITVDSTTPSGSYQVAVSGVSFANPAGGQSALGLLFGSDQGMATNDPNRDRISATIQLIRSIAASSSNSRLAIADFGAGVDTAYYFRLLQRFTPVTDTPDLFSALDSLTAVGQSPLYTSILRYLSYMDTAAPSAAFVRRLVVLTDANDTTSAPGDNLSAVVASANAKSIPIYLVGLGPNVDGDSLGKLASAAHGFYIHASDLGQAFQDLDFVFREGYDVVNAAFAPVPNAGADVNGKMIVTSATSASATLKFRIP